MPALKRAVPAAFLLACVHACGGQGRTPSSVGDACSVDRPCGGALACVTSPTFPGGYCSRDCAETPCPEGSLCDRSTVPPLCLAACTAHEQCRERYQCWRGACRPRCDADPGVCGERARCEEDGRCAASGCTDDGDCPSGHRCEAGACVEVPVPVDGGPAPLPLGDPCAADAECGSGVCAPADRGGRCTTPCTGPTECIALVPFEASCAPAARGGQVETLCVPYNASGARPGAPCTRDADCETSTCIAGQCTDVCETDADCIPGQVCAPLPWGGGTFVGCGYAPGAGLDEIDLGTHDLSAGAGTRALSFATPPDSVSVTLLARTIAGDALPLGFYVVRDPRGSTIFDLAEISALRDTPVRWLPVDTEEAIGMLVPNATPERLSYLPGRYEMQVVALARTEGDPGRNRVQVSALVKRVPGGVVSGGSIDLDVHLVGVGVTAATAPSSTRVRGALSRFGEILATAGIRVGDVAYHDVGDTDASTYQVLDAETELAGLFRLSAPRSGARLDVFLVRSIESGGDGFNTLGIAGGIPGPSTIHGSAHSGVVVAFDPAIVGASGALAGHVLAHEAGHFLGLFHVTERARPCGPGETPPACAPFGGTDVIGDTIRGDETNLMHWALVGSGTNDALTAGQAYVLVRSALVR